MIENTFILLDGIGDVTERNLWQSEVVTWDDFLSRRGIEKMSAVRKKKYDRQLMKAQGKLESGNSSYFSHKLHYKEHWRLYEKWENETCFLDIETTGFYHGITMVGIYSCDGYRSFVRGINLEKDMLAEELRKYKILVTFYGRAFDMPFIERELGITVDIPHIDLCFTGKKIGLKGGLKKVEVQVGISREEDICGLNGLDAVRLWNQYMRGDEESLDLLIRYNEADTVNLKTLADIMYSRLREETFLRWQVGFE
ncbi:MAG: ribonuclease H-like domain-containing protein [Theionarchaea archaeon]|nr:ribonuclease H-like domain-containing protein [Theionarchaea archaeon]MBU7000868.1 ribonuclease H-like domain-containing protein [Theionarchaea archaeon]MBU7021913.1 ribonuclease H-like domain-containing protein [Theionarchaea archaeon]MBU7035930.1 ribonuclease H-like domain-containing protein [Theionarchaea archaeon]MBU7040362.1 ribonuclease H-like domain-containing protein [Theionarchaea archaeon]